jgi:hypothetical protein
LTAFERIQLRDSRLGNTIRDEKIFNSKYLIDNFLSDDPSYKTNVEILDKGFIDLRMNNYKLVQSTTPQMDIQASLLEPITFKLGDVFFYDDGYWICIESINRHDIERTGKVEECNYYLQWQNPYTLEITGRWCSVRDPYSLAIDERAKVVITGNAKYKIKLPYDAETELFHAGRRFLIDFANNEPIAYSIIKYDAVTNKYTARNEGFLVITLQESQLQDDDNWGLMIANYKDPATMPHTPESIVGLCTIKYSGISIIKAGGSAKSFYSEFYDSDNNLIISLLPTWDLILPPELDSNQVIIVSQINNEIKLQVNAKAEVGTEFILRMSGNDLIYGGFESELVIEVGGLF